MKTITITIQLVAKGTGLGLGTNAIPLHKTMTSPRVDQSNRIATTPGALSCL